MLLANIITNEVARELKNTTIDELNFTAVDIASLIKMLDDDIISMKIVKQVFEYMVETGENPNKIVEDKGLVQITNVEVILPILKDIISNNSDNVEKYKAGNKKLLGFFVGQVLKATNGKASPQIVNQLVAQQLDN
jgi:glutaminyl-tRNA synthetase